MINLNAETSAPKVVPTGECWFCQQTKPLGETMYVMLNFLTERNVENYGSYKEIETKWLTQTFSVPRCGECFGLHEKYVKAYRLTKILLWVIYLVSMALLAWNIYHVNGWIAAAVIFGIATVIFRALLNVVGKYIFILIKMTADALGWNTDRRCRNFPPIAELLEQGWSIGDNPDVTPEADAA